MKATKPADKVVSNDISFLKDKFNLDVNKINKKLQYILDP